MMRWATLATGFRSKPAKARHYARMPTFVVPHVRTCQGQGTGVSMEEMEERNGKAFTGIGQHRDHIPFATEPRFQRLEHAAGGLPSTMDHMCLCGETNLPKLPRSVFIGIHNVNWAVWTL